MASDHACFYAGSTLADSSRRNCLRRVIAPVTGPRHG